MTDESYSFTAAKTRLDEIVTQVRKKDTSLEKSLDLLEEGVRLANVCTELIDHADWASAPGVVPADGDDAGSTADASVQTDAAVEQDADAVAEAGAEVGEDPEAADTDGLSDTAVESVDADIQPDAAIGDMWSEDEAWADEAEDDPSDGDDGHGD